MPLTRLAIAVVCGLYATAVLAAPQEYLIRNAERDRAAFEALDLNRDGVLTREEIQGNIDMQARFNDFDSNRDGAIDRDELARYIAARYGIPQAAK